MPKGTKLFIDDALYSSKSVRNYSTLRICVTMVIMLTNKIYIVFSYSRKIKINANKYLNSIKKSDILHIKYYTFIPKFYHPKKKKKQNKTKPTQLKDHHLLY